MIPIKGLHKKSSRDRFKENKLKKTYNGYVNSTLGFFCADSLSAQEFVIIVGLPIIY